MIMGVGGQLTDRPAELPAELVKRGYRVVIYDNRDAGLSTRFESSGLPDWPAIFAALGAGKSPQVAYSLEDMASDAVGRLRVHHGKHAESVSEDSAMRHEDDPEPPAAQDRAIASAIERDRGRLWSFISRRVHNQVGAEDTLQDVFYELVVAYRLMKPIEEAGAWMIRVARNRIIDLVRRKKAVSLNQPAGTAKDDSNLRLEHFLPSADAGPDAEYARRLLITELEDALSELTPKQRAVFLAHEFEGRSFRELAAETGLSVNALLSRKHQAVKRLRQRLQGIYDEVRTQERRTR